MKEPNFKTVRRQLKSLSLTNPNYFGQLSEMGINTDYKVVEKIIFNTTYEALGCVSYHPDDEELRATVMLKKDSGYGGSLCTGGSHEFVRFYIDYNDDGNWTDLGSTNFKASNMDFGDGGLCYGVVLKIKPEVKRCCNKTPVLPKVRAVLSWNNEPPANQPNYVPVWGDRKEAYIQIKPNTSIFCYLQQLELIPEIDLSALAKQIQVQPKPISSALNDALNSKAELPKLTKPNTFYDYDFKKVAFGRSGLLSINKVLKLNTEDAATAIQNNFSKIPMDEIIKAVKVVSEPKFNTKYEEVECVALDRNTSILHADIRVKLSSGYSGDLCDDGSKEYIAFYMDFGSGWEYMGTSSVEVHDIDPMPADGLMYHAYLPTNLSSYQQQWCESGKAKVRAILSWNIAPPVNDPNYIAVYGDREDCLVEIKPLPEGIIPGLVFPVIDSVGGMLIEDIDMAGYANGTGPTGLKANDSPFDGLIEVIGQIGNAPDYSSGGGQLEYRLMKKGPLDLDFQPVIRSFDIRVKRYINGIPVFNDMVSQMPDPVEGWMPYYPDFYPNDITFVSNDLLGVFVPSDEGLHELRVDIKQGGSFIDSEIIHVMVDKTPPHVDVEITSGEGNCGKFQKGAIISGTFTANDKHPGKISFAITPADEANGANAKFTEVNGGAVIPKSSMSYGVDLPGTDLDGDWELDTAAMDPCGYNIRLTMNDRTIINSRHTHRHGKDIEGFCLSDGNEDCG